MLELDERLRDLIDGAASPVTMAEVIGRSTGTTGRRVGPRVSRLVIAAAAVLVAVMVMLLLVTQSRPSGLPRITTPASTPSLGVTSECTVTPGSTSGCPRTLSEAEVILGINLRTPSVVPNGWTLVRHNVVVYPPDYQGLGNAAEVLGYNQTWAPNGTDLATDADPLYLQIKQRAVLPTDDRACTTYAGGHTQLADGTIACGQIPSIRGSYGPNGPEVFGGLLQWTSNGVTYQVHDIGLTNDEVVRVLNSLTPPSNTCPPGSATASCSHGQPDIGQQRIDAINRTLPDQIPVADAHGNTPGFMSKSEFDKLITTPGHDDYRAGH